MTVLAEYSSVQYSGQQCTFVHERDDCRDDPPLWAGSSGHAHVTHALRQRHQYNHRHHHME